MPEPTPVRDVGPFTDGPQAMRQYEAQMYGIPGDIRFRAGPLMVVQEAALIAGLELTDHEQARLADTIGSEEAVIIAGLIIRAATHAKLTDEPSQEWTVPLADGPLDEQAADPDAWYVSGTGHKRHQFKRNQDWADDHRPRAWCGATLIGIVLPEHQGRFVVCTRCQHWRAKAEEAR